MLIKNHNNYNLLAKNSNLHVKVSPILAKSSN
jgi:hypothetical protein